MDWESHTEQLDDGEDGEGCSFDEPSCGNLPIGEGFGGSVLLKDEAIMYYVIVERLKKQLKPERSALVVRYEFDNRARNSGESVSHYVATLKHLATECKFGEAVRTERLRDWLVSGIRNLKRITDLLKVKLADLTFELAV